MTKLKPCPFCGGKSAEVLNALEEQPEMELIGLTKDNWNVVCQKCFAMSGTRRTAAEAIEAWEQRVGDELMERMEDDGK
jgi:Lar family restriction alleviation protein